MPTSIYLPTVKGTISRNPANTYLRQGVTVLPPAKADGNVSLYFFPLEVPAYRIQGVPQGVKHFKGYKVPYADSICTGF